MERSKSPKSGSRSRSQSRSHSRSNIHSNLSAGHPRYYITSSEISSGDEDLNVFGTVNTPIADRYSATFGNDEIEMLLHDSANPVISYLEEGSVGNTTGGIGRTSELPTGDISESIPNTGELDESPISDTSEIAQDEERSNSSDLFSRGRTIEAHPRPVRERSKGPKSNLLRHRSHEAAGPDTGDDNELTGVSFSNVSPKIGALESTAESSAVANAETAKPSGKITRKEIVKLTKKTALQMLQDRENQNERDNVSYTEATEDTRNFRLLRTGFILVITLFLGAVATSAYFGMYVKS